MSAPRLDRLMTLGVVLPLVRLIRADAAPALPVLMYHSISDDEEPGFSPYYRVCTSPAVFARQMGLLAQLNCVGTDLETGLRDLGRTRADGRRPVAITFDDGFRDFHTQAFPVLRERGFSASMFLPTASIGEERRSFKGRECLTWGEVAELHRAGMRFGSHTVNHPLLHGMGRAEIAAELGISRREIEDHLGTPITTFAYPYGFPEMDRSFMALFHQLLTENGYSCCVTTIVGRHKPGDDPFVIRRLPANTCDDARLLSAKLAGAYDWMRVPQSYFKKLTHSLRRGR